MNNFFAKLNILLCFKGSAFLLLCLLSLLAHSQEFTIKGTVYDQDTREALAFVNIVKSNTIQGGVTDIEGRFKLTFTQKPDTLTFSYVGYTSLSYPVADKKEHIIFLKRTDILLDEVTIFSVENPAHRIIDSVLKYRDINNPENLKTFNYKAHNKLTFGIDTEKMSQKNAKDSLENVEIEKMMNKTYLMIIESITERKYVYPNNSKETVLASKVSGLNDPLFSLIASQLQTFSFYTEYINIMDKSFLNPISKGTTERYFFLIEDTLYKELDTVFIISFRPRRNKNFDGLSGLLYINTNGYALQHVNAEPAEGSIATFNVKLKQTYEMLEDNKWFPVQLNTELTYKYPQSELKIFGNGRTYIRDIEINGKVSKKELGNVEYDILFDAQDKDDSFWEQYRYEPLSEKDIETYRLLDSLSKKHNFNRFSGLFKTLIEGKIPYKIFNIDIDKLFGFNNYYGWRLGLGLETNQKVSRFITIGGYAAYSFKRDNLRYGASVNLSLNKRLDMFLKYNYINDDTESAPSDIFDLTPRLKLNDFRTYLVRNTDYTQMHKFSFTVRPLKYWLSKVSYTVTELSPNFDYMFAHTSENVSVLRNNFRFAELSLMLRFAYKEKFIQSVDYRYSLGTTFPIVSIGISKGLKGIDFGDYDFTRIDVQIEKDFFIKLLGTSSFRVSAGFINKELPYSKMYNGIGSFDYYSIYAPYTFNTMRMNEFLSDKYLFVFYTHNFGKLLYKSKKFQPEFAITSNYGLGSLKTPQVHRNITFSNLSKSYFESGLVINNLINAGFYSLGICTFYRYGPYSLPKTIDNFAFKLAFKLNL